MKDMNEKKKNWLIKYLIDTEIQRKVNKQKIMFEQWQKKKKQRGRDYVCINKIGRGVNNEILDLNKNDD